MSFNTRYNSGNNDPNILSGILRRKHSAPTETEKKEHRDLLVFGYAAKIFRDDKKSREIDHGKHLIPWMGDNNLRIDRYDVRGALYELTPHEPPPGGYGNRLDYLTADEQRAEQLCEEERYLFLYNNEEDVITKQEEELKRLKHETNGGDYSQVCLSYDETQQIGPSRDEFSNSPTCEEPEQVFKLPHRFEVPSEMQLPETMKQHAIIEKTARFIASQGVQMEILLKAKQSNNAQFEFLSQNSILNPYYKHVLNAIKNGIYPDKIKTNDGENGETDPSNGFPGGILDSVETKPAVIVPTIKYKPSADCAYTQLISKIKGVPLSELHDESSRQSITSQQESANNSPSITPILLQYNGASFITEQDDSSDSNSRKTATNIKSSSLDDSGPKVEILKNSSALALAQNYSSDSESENEQQVSSTFKKEKTPPNLEFPVPTENLKNIIDKTAVYVIKNGRQFEETLRSKDTAQQRFTFLLPDNEYYPYYMYKITGDHNAASKEQKQRKAKEVAEALMSKKGLTRDKLSNNPVSFSIKIKDECPSNTLQNTVLPQDDEEDNEDKATASSTSNNSNQQVNRHVPEHVQKAIELVESQLMARNAQIAAALALRQSNSLPAKNALPSANIPSTINIQSAVVTGSTIASNSSFASATAPTKAEAERNAIFEQQQQQRHKELKKAEEKVKDKLAQIAREKLGGLVSKEKQLQLERKRKAMAFLNQIKAVSSGENKVELEAQTEEKKIENKDELVSDDSNDSVQSIPITSYGPEGNSDEESAETLRLHKIPAHVVNPKVTTTKLTKPGDEDHVYVHDTSPNRLIIGKRKSRSRNRESVECTNIVTSNKRQYRKHDSISPSSSCSTDDNDVAQEKLPKTEKRKYRSKSRSKSKSHKSKKSKSKKSKNKKKSKKRNKSRTRSRSRSRSTRHHRRSRSKSHSDYSDEDSSDSHRYQSKRFSQTPSQRSHKDKRHRYE